MFGYATFFPINRCPVSVITFWIKEAHSGGIEGHTRTLERALGGRPKRHLGPLGGSLGHRGGPPCHNALRGSLKVKFGPLCFNMGKRSLMSKLVDEVNYMCT